MSKYGTPVSPAILAWQNGGKQNYEQQCAPGSQCTPAREANLTHSAARTDNEGNVYHFQVQAVQPTRSMKDVAEQYNYGPTLSASTSRAYALAVSGRKQVSREITVPLPQNTFTRTLWDSINRECGGCQEPNMEGPPAVLPVKHAPPLPRTATQSATPQARSYAQYLPGFDDDNGCGGCEESRSVAHEYEDGWGWDDTDLVVEPPPVKSVAPIKKPAAAPVRPPLPPINAAPLTVVRAEAMVSTTELPAPITQPLPPERDARLLPVNKWGHVVRAIAPAPIVAEVPTEPEAEPEAEPVRSIKRSPIKRLPASQVRKQHHSGRRPERGVNVTGVWPQHQTLDEAMASRFVGLQYAPKKEDV